MLKFFSSMKAGLVIMGLISIASIIATLQPQSTIYESFWFRGLLLLLTINLTVCTTRRLPALLNKFSNSPTMNIGEINSEKAQKANNSQEAEDKIIKTLSSQGYKTNIVKEGNKSFVFARKGFADLLAPHFIHISLIIIAVGALMGSFGHKENVSGEVGQTVEIPQQLGKVHLHMKVNDFQTLYDSNNDIDNWISDITILDENDIELARGTTKVNNPFKYKNMTFYQSGYGYEHNVSIKGDQEGDYVIPVGKLFSLADRMVRIEPAMGKGLVLKVFESHTKFDTYDLTAGTVVNLPKDTTFTYVGEKAYTVLRVKTDPGTPVVMAGFLIMSIGSFLIWTSRYREVRIGFDHNKGLVQFNVVSKNKSLQDEIKEELSSLV